MHMSTDVPLVVAAVPRPQTGPPQRPPAVAGTFYPAEPAQLSRTVDDLLGLDQPPRDPWAAAMVPHAALKYSGRLAAAVLRRIAIPETVIIIGPKHSRLGVDSPWRAPDLVFAGHHTRIGSPVGPAPVQRRRRSAAGRGRPRAGNTRLRCSCPAGPPGPCIPGCGHNHRCG